MLYLIHNISPKQSHVPYPGREEQIDILLCPASHHQRTTVDGLAAVLATAGLGCGAGRAVHAAPRPHKAQDKIPCMVCFAYVAHYDRGRTNADVLHRQNSSIRDRRPVRRHHQRTFHIQPGPVHQLSASAIPRLCRWILRRHKRASILYC